MEQPHIKVSHKGGITVVALLDEDILDEITIRDITDALFSVAEENAPVKMILNFERVVHLSSNSLGSLIRLNKTIEENAGVLKLCCIKSNLLEMFVITKVNKIFEIYDTEEAALLAFES
jgi:anti-sigma B factor antagonist